MRVKMMPPRCHRTHQSLTLRRGCELDAMRDKKYYGDIKSNATVLLGEFPRKFLGAWDTLTGFQHLDFVASVFMNDPEKGLGCHHFPDPENPERCNCPQNFWERDFKDLQSIWPLDARERLHRAAQSRKEKLKKRAQSVKAHIVFGEAK